MDHLKTDQERKNRWYATHVKTNYVHVQTLDFEAIRENSGLIKINKSKEFMQQAFENDKVPGVPISLLHMEETKSYLTWFLKEHGFIVIKDVLNASECEHALDLAWDYIEHASAAEHFSQTNGGEEGNHSVSNNHFTPPVSRVNFDTHKSKYYPRSLEGRIFPFYGSGHSSFMWYLRSHSFVKEVFATINNVKSEDLITSLDGIILWNKMIDNYDTLDRGWFHIDQNPITKRTFSSIQGLVNLLPVTKESGGNVLVSGSHHLFPNHYLQKNKKIFYEDRLKEISGDDWLEIDPNDDLLFQQRKNVITCLLGSGDMLIWDSRTVHCSYPGGQQKQKVIGYKSNDPKATTISHSSHGLIRAAGLVNMIPRIKCPESVRMDRLGAIESSRTLTHYPDKVSPLGEERTEEVIKEERCVRYMKKMQVIEGKKILLSYDDLNDAQKKLV